MMLIGGDGVDVYNSIGDVSGDDVFNSPVDAAASVGGIADVLSVLLLWFISSSCCHCCSSCCFHTQLEFQFFSPDFLARNLNRTFPRTRRMKIEKMLMAPFMTF